MKKINLALLGMGRMGKVHFDNLRSHIPNATLRVVADPFYEPDFGNEIEFTRDAEEAISRADIDGVVICTPTSTHADLVANAIDAGKHIFCEKPLDLSVEKTISLTEKAKLAGIKLMLGFNRRFDTAYMDAKQSIAAGKVGDVQVIKITNRDPGLPPVAFLKTSGGIFLDFTIHDFDMAHFLMEKEAVEVFAKGMVLIDPEVAQAGDVDTALTIVTFADGTYAVLDNSRKAVYGYDQRIEIFGSGGMIQVENNLYHQNVLFNETGIHQALPLNAFMQRYIASYRKEVETFVDAVVNDKPVPVGGEEAIQASMMAIAAKQSMESGKPVQLAQVREQLAISSN